MQCSLLSHFSSDNFHAKQTHIVWCYDDNFWKYFRISDTRVEKCASLIWIGNNFDISDKLSHIRLESKYFFIWNSAFDIIPWTFFCNSSTYKVVSAIFKPESNTTKLDLIPKYLQGRYLFAVIQYRYIWFFYDLQLNSRQPLLELRTLHLKFPHSCWHGCYEWKS